MEDYCPQGDNIERHNAIQAMVKDLEKDGFYESRCLDQALQMAHDAADCRTCGGMVVDLTTGVLYCGLNPPSEVIARNEIFLEPGEEKTRT